MEKARVINNIRSKKKTGIYPSKKMQRNIQFESLLERDYIFLLEYDYDIQEYREQPVTIEYKFNNRIYKYTPDFEIIMNNGQKRLVEVKPYEKLKQILNDKKKRLKYDAAYTFCQKEGFEFIIVTDKDIWEGNLLNNIKYLQFYSNIIVPEFFRKLIKYYLIDNGPTELNKVISVYHQYDKGIVKQYILSLVYNHFLNVDMESEIDKNCIVYYKEN